MEKLKSLLVDFFTTPGVVYLVGLFWTTLLFTGAVFGVYGYFKYNPAWILLTVGSLLLVISSIYYSMKYVEKDDEESTEFDW